MSQRAVSEVFGAMLTLLVMVTAAGLIYMISHPTIFSSIDNINYRNAVKTIAEIKELVERMKFGNEIATTKTIQLNMGSIYTSSGLNLSCIVGGVSMERQLQDLNIEVSGRIVTLESGIFEKAYGRAIPIPISEPSVIATSDTVYFTFYNFVGNFSAGGSKVTMIMKYMDTLKFNTSELEIETEFCELWKKAIEKADPGILTESDCGDRRLVVSAPEISVLIVSIEVS
ncbi:MAG: hypothetical protein QFX37_01895 [Archaeoglobales archaeon]|nr:hypothetical protein [Archaeoglobales archaeon]